MDEKHISMFREEIRKRLFELKDVIEVRLIGSAVNQNQVLETYADIDIVVIVKNDIDLFDYVKKIVPISKEIGCKFNVLVNIYPVKEYIYDEGKTEFAKNVKHNGKVL